MLAVGVLQHRIASHRIPTHHRTSSSSSSRFRSQIGKLAKTNEQRQQQHRCVRRGGECVPVWRSAAPATMRASPHSPSTRPRRLAMRAVGWSVRVVNRRADRDTSVCVCVCGGGGGGACGERTITDFAIFSSASVDVLGAVKLTESGFWANREIELFVVDYLINEPREPTW
jgi:hypothetical protein